MDHLQTQAVDPSRLDTGTWSDQFNKTIGEGDIAASYSGDRIGMGKPLRKPFVHRGEAWVCVSRTSIPDGGPPVSKAYRLVPIDWYSERLEGEFRGYFYGSYAEKTADCEAARADPNGFYHGVIVQCGKHYYVMFGPPVQFTPKAVEQQAGLFDAMQQAGGPS